ncbi:MAG: TIGR02270 family protein [Nannocystales bacterium]
MTETRSDTILWDVVEEHLDEAEFLAETWHVNLDSPAYLREEFEQGPQERLLAHVDGLVVGGEEVRAELLEPALADEDTERWRAAAVALSLLSHPNVQFAAPLFDGLDERPEEVRLGIADALAMSSRSDLDVRITDALRRGGEPAHLTALATVGGMRGANPGNLVDGLLQGADESGRAAAVSMLPYGDRRYLNWVEHSLTGTTPELQWAAARAGLVMGSGPAWQQVGRWGLADEPDPEAMVLLASLADRNITQRIADRADDEAVRPRVLHALGYSGRRLAMETCLTWLGDETAGPLAGEAFAAMTGLPLDDDAFWDDVEDDDGEDDENEDVDDLEEDLEEEDLDEDLGVSAEQELRIPKPEAILAWWEERQSRFDAKKRYIAGRPADQVAIAHALKVLPMRRHHALAFELLVRSKGTVNLRTRALTFASTELLAGLPGIPYVDGNRVYGQH